jgi:hypothetical protein
MVAPFAGWLTLYIVSMRFFVPAPGAHGAARRPMRVR